MRIQTLTTDQSTPHQRAFMVLLHRVMAAGAIPAAALASILAFAPWLAAAQRPAAQPPDMQPATPQATSQAASPSHRTVSSRKYPKAAPTPAPTPVPPPQPIVAPTPAPEIPNWPANESSSDALVTWDSKGLRIDAGNSSLRQILKDFATASGAKVEGLTNDERVFGVYGPGNAREILNQLLEGSGYNVLMIGDQGQGAPREIFLTPRTAGGAQPAANNPNPNSSEEEQDSEEPQQPPPGMPGHMPPNMHSRQPPGVPYPPPGSMPN